METTLNMRIDISKKINAAALAGRISRSETIIILMKRVMNDDSNRGRIGKMVQYQERRRPEEWRKFHMSLREDEYE